MNTRLAMGLILFGTAPRTMLAQGTAATLLQIDVENIVSYTTDVFDASKFATDPNTTSLAAPPRNFAFVMAVGDVIAVNGKPARGSLVVRQQSIALNPTPNPGQGVADVVRTSVSDYLIEVQQADGTPVGNIYCLGFPAARTWRLPDGQRRQFDGWRAVRAHFLVPRGRCQPPSCQEDQVPVSLRSPKIQLKGDCTAQVAECGSQSN